MNFQVDSGKYERLKLSFELVKKNDKPTPKDIDADTLFSFILVLKADGWLVFDYQPRVATRMMEDRSLIQEASLDELRTLLTWFVRSEHWCHNGYTNLLATGFLDQIMERLDQLFKVAE